MNRHQLIRQWLINIALSFALIVVSTSINAATFTAYGPQDITRGNGKPVTETISFSVNNPDATTYTLNLYNGGLAGANKKISSAQIGLNDNELYSQKDFNQKTTTLSQAVALQADNILIVELDSKPGGVITLEIVGVDEELPSITAEIAPTANSNGWHKDNITVSFTCSDAISGISSCTNPVTVSTEGANQTIEGAAIDNAGNTATTSVTIKLDKTNPEISSSSTPIANTSSWNNSDVTTTFACSDSLRACQLIT